MERMLADTIPDLIESSSASHSPSPPRENEEFHDLAQYLKQVMSLFHQPCSPATTVTKTAHHVFEILTNRQFSYLGRTKSAPYWPSIQPMVVKAMTTESPISFFYDIGGGYRASAQQGQALSFNVGLAELLMLSQIALFSLKIRSIYSPGIRFSLVIDNLCANLVNDIPVNNTLSYCDRLRCLIEEVGMAGTVDLLVESELASIADLEAALRHSPVPQQEQHLTAKHVNNVNRFVGQACSEPEASHRAMRYRSVVAASEQILAPFIKGVHMTQRATSSTICFRPFPGGDSRIQCGEVVLIRNSKDKLHPILMTNIRSYSCRRYQFSDILPRSIQSVSYVEPRPDIDRGDPIHAPSSFPPSLHC